MIISEWLWSGGAYTQYTDPACWVKLLLDQETERSFDRMLAKKLSSGKFISINILMDVLYELVTSRRSLKSRRKAFFGMYNKPLLMGKEGDKLDTFVSQLSRDMAACKLVLFRWTDYSILIMINTLRSSDKHEEKLGKRLNQLYNAAEAEKKLLDITTMQQEI